jgi:fused signal recognition particle receptor
VQDSLKKLLKARGGNSALNLVDETPNVIMIVGVNGGGKTTTIGKLSKKFTDEGAKVNKRNITLRY